MVNIPTAFFLLVHRWMNYIGPHEDRYNTLCMLLLSLTVLILSLSKSISTSCSRTVYYDCHSMMVSLMYISQTQLRTQ